MVIASMKGLFGLPVKDLWNVNNAALGVHGSFLLLYEILGLENTENNVRIANFLNN